MSETTEPAPAAEAPTGPSPEHLAATAGHLRNIAELLRRGLFAGGEALALAQAVQFCEGLAASFGGNVKLQKAAKKRAVKAVKRG